jgi:hypothetical protein
MPNQNLLNSIDQLKQAVINDSIQTDSVIMGYKTEIQKDFIRKAAMFYEICAPNVDENLYLTIPSSEITNEPYLLRLHAAFSAKAKVITIHCTNENV